MRSFGSMQGVALDAPKVGEVVVESSTVCVRLGSGLWIYVASPEEGLAIASAFEDAARKLVAAEAAAVAAAQPERGGAA